MTDTIKAERPIHPNTGNWSAAPLFAPLTAAEVAAIVGITSQSVTNRFQGGKAPAGWTVRRTPGVNLYMRVK